DLRSNRSLLPAGSIAPQARPDGRSRALPRSLPPPACSRTSRLTGARVWVAFLTGFDPSVPFCPLPLSFSERDAAPTLLRLPARRLLLPLPLRPLGPMSQPRPAYASCTKTGRAVESMILRRWAPAERFWIT